jgi:hypothetical protein
MFISTLIVAATCQQFCPQDGRQVRIASRKIDGTGAAYLRLAEQATYLS